jgi:hypothetical protein
MKTVYAILFLLSLSSMVPLEALGSGATSVELRAAAFFHQSDRFRKIYGNVGQNYQMEISAATKTCALVWLNAGWAYQKGKSTRLQNYTRVNIADFSMGVKFPFYFKERCMSYVGIGPNFARVWLKNRTCFDSCKIWKDSVGGVVKVGLNYLFCHNVFIDVFVDYVYQPVKFQRQVDVGGLKTGLGFGLYF